MPRVSLRRAIVYVSVVATVSIFLVTLQHPNSVWLPVLIEHGERGVVPPSHPVLLQVDMEGIDQETGKRIEVYATKKDELVTIRKHVIENNIVGGFLPAAPPNVTLTTQIPEKRIWYLKGGMLGPPEPSDPENYKRTQKLWPDEDPGDRIVDQLMYKPPSPKEGKEGTKTSFPFKKILMYNGMNTWGLIAGRGQFMKLKCPVDTCVLTGSRSDMSSADAIMFKDHFSLPNHKRDPRQIWIMYMLECPLHTQNFNHRNVFNWTATYRHDSDIVAPYEKWVYFDNKIRQKPQEINYSANKTKQVAWFVSNCGARNNRLQFAKELSKYINVDIYGACGEKRCPRSNANKCFEMLNKDYKFYLAFENANCRDYISEKFYVNGLSHNIIPIAMGAHPDDYRRDAPEKSFIHVDDFDSPRELADYLHLLDQNDDMYNEYFRWKGTGEFINTYFMCRLCALVHDEDRVSRYEDINAWWRGKGTCINGSWRKYDKMIANKNNEKVP